jgi:hypothetical protein
MKTTLLLLPAAIFLLRAPLHGAGPAKPLADVRVFAVYEPVFSRQDVELLSRVRPDFVCRGWFKWHHTPDWQRYAPLARACAERGILLQGGITLAAVYPGENGMDDAAFRDFATHGTDGRPYHVNHYGGDGWYHLSLYNPKVVDYLKREARLQLDAGAAGIWYDEIEGYYDWNPTEGYDPYACAAFRDWLIHKYCDGQGWRDDDPRWQTQFGIDLAKHGGSIRSFDYLLHLRTTPGKDGKPLADNPPQGWPKNWAASPNPLYREWGYAWDRKAAGTFRFDTVSAIFADILADADRYARERHGRTLVNTYNHNGTARPGVAFLQPHNGAQPPLRKGRLDGRVSYLAYYEGAIADAAEICPDQPVVFFVDWPGETDRLTALPRADQTHFFSIYLPESYAAGGEFALPLRGYSYVAARQGTLAYLARMADFYREHAPFLRQSGARVSSPVMRVDGQSPISNLKSQITNLPSLTLRVRASSAGTAVHLVNHAFSTRDVWPQPRTNLTVAIPWDGSPTRPTAFAVSPDFPEQRPVPCTLKDGTLTLDVDTVTCSALVLLPEPGTLRPVTGTAASGAHLLDPQGRALAVARDGRFTLWLRPDTAEIECLETGERLPARDGAAFAAPPAGGFVSGLLLDEFGIPIRHADSLNAGGLDFRTDAWGRFRIPLARTKNGVIGLRLSNSAYMPLPATNTAFTAWQVRRNDESCFIALNGFWGNWPDKEKNKDMITLSFETHLDTPQTLRCTFSPAPRVPWSNINSPVFTVTGDEHIALLYAGDGTPRTVYATLHADRRFYRTSLSLESKDWQPVSLNLADFRDEDGTPFDPAKHTGNVAFQLAPAALGDTPATLWLAAAAVVPDTPVKRLWQSDAAFDDVDVDNLRAGHRPQTPPPAVASREPLVRFAGSAPDYLANWDGKGQTGAQPLVVIERITPEPPAAPFLRVTLPAGECAWGNANIPLPLSKLGGQDGLALRLRAAPADAGDIGLALHAMPQSGQAFYHTDVETGETWADAVLPWSDFRAHNGTSFAPAPGARVDLQICRPHGALTRPLVVDLEAIDAFRAE